MHMLYSWQTLEHVFSSLRGLVSVLQYCMVSDFLLPHQAAANRTIDLNGEQARSCLCNQRL